jgi:hypothetical protein
MTMTAFELEGLQLLGYSKRESEFLLLVATHSGYFTSRQFKGFAQSESGSVIHAFTKKVLDRKHATFHAYRSGGRVYHLFARRVYQAIDRENLRTRKKHELEYVKTRLVALDFVLGHPLYRYLETERDKVALFENAWNVKKECLPVKEYRARRSADFTLRYFVDRFPMFVDGQSSPPVPTFTYVEAGAVTLEAFGTHLRAYLGLFQALPKLEFVYLAPTPRLFHAAEAEFKAVLNWRRSQAKPVSVMKYFRVRKAWEAKDRVASADVVLLKEAQAQYVGSKVDELYEKWRQGTITDSEVTQSLELASPAGNYLFRATVCGSSLSVFNDPRGNGMGTCTEGEIEGVSVQNSASRSIQISGI